MTTDTTRRTDAVPPGWPPNTPVEVMRIARPLMWVCVTCTLAMVGAIVVSTWVTHEMLNDVLHELRRL